MDREEFYAVTLTMHNSAIIMKPKTTVLTSCGWPCGQQPSPCALRCVWQEGHRTPPSSPFGVQDGGA